jgi:hypothetical protein
MWSVNEVASVKVDLDAKVLGVLSAEDRTGGVAARCFRVLIGRPASVERDHRCQSTIARSYVCRPRTDSRDPRFLQRRGARSATRRGPAAICRVPLIENSKARAACPGVCGRIPMIPGRSRRVHRWSEFGSTDPTLERSGALRPCISFNAVFQKRAFCEDRHGHSN